MAESVSMHILFARIKSAIVSFTGQQYTVGMHAQSKTNWLFEIFICKAQSEI
jgi:hypothetical protein